MKHRRLLLAAEVTVLALTALFLFGALRGQHRESSDIRGYIIERGSEETGALNLVTAIYLGYRAFDTLGETIVLLIAVTGVLYFLMSAEGKHEEDDDT